MSANSVFHLKSGRFLFACRFDARQWPFGRCGVAEVKLEHEVNDYSRFFHRPQLGSF
jgi:hypothetical protein